MLEEQITLFGLPYIPRELIIARKGLGSTMFAQKGVDGNKNQADCLRLPLSSICRHQHFHGTNS